MEIFLFLLQFWYWSNETCHNHIGFFGPIIHESFYIWLSTKFRSTLLQHEQSQESCQVSNNNFSDNKNYLKQLKIWNDEFWLYIFTKINLISKIFLKNEYGILLMGKTSLRIQFAIFDVFIFIWNKIQGIFTIKWFQKFYLVKKGNYE